MEVIALAQATLDRLREDDGLVLETEDELRGALADEGVTIDDVLSWLGRAALDARAYKEMIEQRMAALELRHARAEGHHETLRATLFQAMQALGLPSFRDAEFNASISSGKTKVFVTDIEALPTHCVHHKVVKTPDLGAIREAIADSAACGKELRGATLSNAQPILTIRTR